MTNIQRVVSALQAEPGLTDAELRERTQVNPHQQVNQICRRLEHQGQLRRIDRADGRIGNYLTENVSSARSAASPTRRPASKLARAPITLTLASATRARAKPAVKDTAIVLPCSGRKTEGGGFTRGASILDLVGAALSARLAKARHDVAAKVRVDETRLLPAWQRYAGTLYQAAHERLAKAVVAGVPLLIISGGYGLVLAEEGVGRYEQRFSLADWPAGLLEECLAAAAEALDVRNVVAFCARTTAYAELVRRAAGSMNRIDAWLVRPEMTGRGGAQVLVPEACGQAVAAFLDRKLDGRWLSSRGVPVRVERVG